jgi:hypothetical protein
MATYTVTNKYLLDNYAVVQLLTPAELELGQSITVSGVDATFNGSFVIRALPQYRFTGVDTEGDLLYDYQEPIANQVLYAKTADDVQRQAATGTLSSTPTCTWIVANDIADWLYGTQAVTADVTFLTICAAAANQFCYRRRAEAGYTDSLTTVPSQDVKLGTIMYGGALYRQRGSIDQFASFDAMSTASVVGLAPIVKQLLGIDRPQVA